MKLKSNLKYIATPVKIFMTVLIVLLAVSILQGIILQIERTFRPSATTKPEAELTQEEKRLNRIRNSAKKFLADGTIHLIHKPRRTPTRIDEPEIEQIYDVNDNLLWEGPSNRRPYRYLSWATKQSRRYVFTRERMKQMQMLTPGFPETLRYPLAHTIRPSRFGVIIRAQSILRVTIPMARKSVTPVRRDLQTRN